MTAPEKALATYQSGDEYLIEGIESVMTPALVIYPDIVESNIEATLRVLGNDPERWRPHVKTSKLEMIMRMLVERGVTNFKCATTLELQTACNAGANDILVAYPMVGANTRRVCEQAADMPEKRISALIEDARAIEGWKGSRVGLFIDLNPGMDRTGVEQDLIDKVIVLAQTIESSGLAFRGLHYYDGHLSKYHDLAAREIVAHSGYDQLMQIVDELNKAGIVVEEVITAGTPAFPCTVSYQPFNEAPFIHRASPGTVVYGDCTSQGQLPDEFGYRPAAVVVTAVVSHPKANRITCDAGHKAVSADAGVPTCTVLGFPEFQPSSPSEEHLPIDIPQKATIPEIGNYLYLVPRHVCPTVNNFDYALIVRDGRITGTERVTARGREFPIIKSPASISGQT